MRTVRRTEFRTAETPVASTVHHPFGNPAGPGLFRVKELQLPAYIQNVAHAFRRKGLSESEAIERAVGVVKDWAAGRAPNGGHVHPDVQAAAAEAVAEWEAAKAAAHSDDGQRFNPNHGAAGSGVGGQFVSAGGGSGGGKPPPGGTSSGKQAPKAPLKPLANKTAPKPRPGQGAARARLLERAASLRAHAQQLKDELHILEHQLKQQHAQAAQAKKHAAAAHKAAHISSKPHKAATAHHKTAKHAPSLQKRIAALRVRIAGLRSQARQLEQQAHGMRSLEAGGQFPGRSAGMALEARAAMSAADQNDLPDDAFAYVEPGGTRDSSGKTVPRSLRHFPVHDAAHTRNALARAPQSPFGDKAMPAIKKAAAKFGINAGDDGRTLLGDEEVRELRINSCYKDLDLSLETRSGDGGEWIGGYASVFQPRESRNLGGFIERVSPSAFSDAKMDGWPDVVCRFNHDNNLVLGTVAAGTLQLRTDRTGLDYQVLPPESRADVRELVQRGDIRYSSFAFRVPRGGDEWGVTDQNFPVRTLHSVELVDVAPVLTPAYPDATAAARATTPALRSLANHMQIAVDEVRALAENDELRRLFVRTDRPVYRPEPKRLFGPQAAALLLTRKSDPFAEED